MRFPTTSRVSISVEVTCAFGEILNCSYFSSQTFEVCSIMYTIGFL